jgi:predicted HicB family RNase H-like nuclease
MSTVSFKKKGNKQIALRVEPSLEEGIQQALKADGDATLSAWIKRIIRKELQARGIEVKD